MRFYGQEIDFTGKRPLLGKARAPTSRSLKRAAGLRQRRHRHVERGKRKNHQVAVVRHRIDRRTAKRRFRGHPGVDEI